MRPILLKLHRWIALVFALPLLLIILTGLMLAVEPMVQASAVQGQSLDAARVVALVKRYDPQGRARGVLLDVAHHRLTLQGADLSAVDLVTGEPSTATTPADVFAWARHTHHRLLDGSWFVTVSTSAAVIIMLLGIAMGWPRLRHSLRGWHQGVAWFILPLVLAGPITGLCMVAGLTFQGSPPPAGRGMSLPDAIGLVAQSHDLGQVMSIGMRGGRLTARIFEGGELRAYGLGADGMVALPRNWPRLLHEGNWSAMISGPLNIAASLVLLTLLVTGVLLWARRNLRRRQRARARAGVEGELAVSAAAE